MIYCFYYNLLRMWCLESHAQIQEQFEALDGIGVSMIQGFYFDKPLKQSAFEKKYCSKG